MKTVGLIFHGEAPSEEPAADKFSCPHCGKGYKTAEGLEKHIKDKHPESVQS